jgi:hypothetical protein
MVKMTHLSFAPYKESILLLLAMAGSFTWQNNFVLLGLRYRDHVLQCSAAPMQIVGNVDLAIRAY